MADIEADAKAGEKVLELTATARPPAKGVPPAVQKPAAGEQAALETLIRAADPLIKTYFEHQKDMQRRELAFEEKVLVAESSHRRTIVRCTMVILVVTLLLAGYLFFNSRDEAAIKIITLVVGLGGAAFGGYGVAVSRHRVSDGDDD